MSIIDRAFLQKVKPDADITKVDTVRVRGNGKEIHQCNEYARFLIYFSSKTHNCIDMARSTNSGQLEGQIGSHRDNSARLGSLTRFLFRLRPASSPEPWCDGHLAGFPVVLEGRCATLPVSAVDAGSAGVVVETASGVIAALVVWPIIRMRDLYRSLLMMTICLKLGEGGSQQSFSG